MKSDGTYITETDVCDLLQSQITLMCGGELTLLQAAYVDGQLTAFCLSGVITASEMEELRRVYITAYRHDYIFVV